MCVCMCVCVRCEVYVFYMVSIDHQLQSVPLGGYLGCSRFYFGAGVIVLSPPAIRRLTVRLIRSSGESSTRRARFELS